jgi:hypothetical protein
VPIADQTPTGMSGLGGGRESGPRTLRSNVVASVPLFQHGHCVTGVDVTPPSSDVIASVPSP